MNNNYDTFGSSKEQVFGAVDSRGREQLIARTYFYLFAAIVAFTILEVILFTTGIAQSIVSVVYSFGTFGIIGVFVLFAALGGLFSNIASGARDKGTQIMALGGYVVLEALIFVPILWMADQKGGGLIENAAAVTLVAFAGLTAIAYYSRKDFSFLRSTIMYGFLIAIVLVIAGAIFGFSLGIFFSVAMVGLAGAAILYETSNIIHHYHEDQYIGAALGLFASVATMFFYILRIFMASDD